MRAEPITIALRSIAANVRRLRIQRGLTQEQLAEAAALDRRTVQALEAGGTNPTAAVLVAVADLELLGLRTRAGKKQNRRGHDMRRTFITLARTDGAIDGLLRWVTHGPTTDMMDVYSSPPWSALCAEVGKLKLSLREGVLVPMPNCGASRWLKPTAEIGRDRALGGHRADRAGCERVQPLVAVAVIKATPTGFEPGGVIPSLPRTKWSWANRRRFLGPVWTDSDGPSQQLQAPILLPRGCHAALKQGESEGRRREIQGAHGLVVIAGSRISC